MSQRRHSFLLLLNGLCRLYGYLGLLGVLLGVLGPPSGVAPLLHGTLMASLLVTSVGLLAYSARRPMWSRTFWRAWFVWMVAFSVVRLVMSDFWKPTLSPPSGPPMGQMLTVLLLYLGLVSLPVHVGIFRYAWREDPDWRTLDGTTPEPARADPGEGHARPDPAP